MQVTLRNIFIWCSDAERILERALMLLFLSDAERNKQSIKMNKILSNLA